MISTVEPTAPAAAGHDAERERMERWAEMLTQLADRTRLRILYQLTRHDELNVGALCELLAQRQPAVSHHLSRLRTAGVITARRDGKQRYYRLLPGSVQGVLQAIFAPDAAATHKHDSTRLLP